MSQTDGMGGATSVGIGIGTPVEGGRGRRAGLHGVWPGLVIVAIAGLAIYAGRNLPSGSAMHVGPGDIARIWLGALLVLGLIIATEGFFRTDLVAPASIAPAIVLMIAGGVAVLAANTLGIVAASSLAAAVVAGYGLWTRPVALVLAVTAGVAAAALAQLPVWLLASHK